MRQSPEGTGFIEQFRVPDWAGGHDWPGRPLAIIARLLKSVIDGDRYETLEQIAIEARGASDATGAAGRS